MESQENMIYYEHICRMCLKYNKIEDMVSLFEKNTNELSCYGKSALYFADITLKKDDDFPTKMCKKCLIQLKQCIRFKFTCETSIKQLQTIQIMSSECFKQNVVEYTLFKSYYPNIPTENINNIPSDSLLEKKYEINCLKVNDIGIKSRCNFSDNCSDTDCQGLSNNNSIEEVKCIDNKAILNTLDKLYPSQDIKDRHTSQIKRKKLKRIKRCLRTSNQKKLARKLIRQSQSKIQCKVCSKILLNSQTYKRHMERHTKGCRFICEHCARGFSTFAELNFHLVCRHTAGPYIQCSQCPFKASQQYDMKEHERIHSGERPFTCDKCGLTFRRRWIWKKHLIHHEEKTIQCTRCPMKFHTRSEMLAHCNNIHERVYVYMCNKCGVTYAKAASVRRHMIDRHGIPREAQGKVTRVKRGSALFPDTVQQ